MLSLHDALPIAVTSPLTRLHRPVLHGVQGVGKSSILRAVARILDADLYDLRLVQVESTDIRGLTVVDPVTGTTKHMRPEFLPVYTTDKGAKKTIVFLDEILDADDRLRKDAFELILDNRVGPHLMGHNGYLDRNIVVQGTSVSVSVARGGRRIIKNKTTSQA